MNRIAILENRIERLIQANKINQYVYSEKIIRYLGALKAIKFELYDLQKKKHKTLNPEKYNFSVTREMMFNLTNPN
jgi:hypothetical protein